MLQSGVEDAAVDKPPLKIIAESDDNDGIPLVTGECRNDLKTPVFNQGFAMLKNFKMARVSYSY